MCSITGSNLALSSEKKTYVTFDSMHPADHVDINLGRQCSGSVNVLTDPDPGGKLITDPTGSGSYQAFFVAFEKYFLYLILPH
jgi:hypothetical protein